MTDDPRCNPFVLKLCVGGQRDWRDTFVGEGNQREVKEWDAMTRKVTNRDYI